MLSVILKIGVRLLSNLPHKCGDHVIENVNRPGGIRNWAVAAKKKEAYFNNLREVSENAVIEPVDSSQRTK